MLCAKMPCVQAPDVATEPVCEASTLPLIAPAPPKPPMPNVTDGTFFSLLNEMPPLTFRPPSPPPPPMLWAIRPAPLVVLPACDAATRSFTAVTLTLPPVPPLPPMPPTPTISAESDTIAATHVQAAGAAAAADARGEDARAAVAVGGDARPGHVDVHVAGVPADAAEPAHAHEQRVTVGLSRTVGDAGADVDRAVPAAAADALRGEAVRAFVQVHRVDRRRDHLPVSGSITPV